MQTLLSPTRPQVQVDDLEELLQLFDLEVREIVGANLEGLEQIALVAERPLQLKVGGVYTDHPYQPRLAEVATAISRLGGFRPDGRVGLKGRLHRISEIRSAAGQSTGMVIRIGRTALGMAEPLRGLVATPGLKLLIVGGPGSRKTTLLRDLLRLSGELQGWGCVLVDTSGEVAGDSLRPHPGVGRVGVVPVHDVREQSKLIVEVMANLGPTRVAVDELKFAPDVEVMDNLARSGVEVVATVHARNLFEFVRKPLYWSLAGYVDIERMRRRVEPAFEVLIEARGGGDFRLHPSAALAIDAALGGHPLEGEKLAL
jgi:stage III sporulation protein SpoIIIAA